MIRFIPYVLKSLWRHRTRTALTVSGAAVGMLVFTCVGAVQQGLADLAEDPSARRTLIVFQANRFCPATSRLPDFYAREILSELRAKGVKDVIPIKVFLNNCRLSLDVVVFHGVPPEKLLTARPFKVAPDELEFFQRNRHVALVGHALAQRRNLSVGQKFSVGEVSVTVGGIYRAENAAEESFLYTHLEFLQRAPGQKSEGLVTQFEVLLEEGADAQEIARAIDAKYRGGPVATDTRTRGVFQARAMGDLVELIGFARYLGLACIALIFALIATTTVMAVQDRIREHALLQTIGFSGRLLFGLVLIESVLVSLIGGLLGVGIATAVLWGGGFAVGTEGVLIAFGSSWSLVLLGLLVTLAVGVGAALVPAWQAARADIVASLRQI